MNEMLNDAKDEFPANAFILNPLYSAARCGMIVKALLIFIDFTNDGYTHANRKKANWAKVENETIKLPITVNLILHLYKFLSKQSKS